MGEKKEMRIPKISYRKFYPHLFSPEETTASEHVLTGKQMFFSTQGRSSWDLSPLFFLQSAAYITTSSSFGSFGSSSEQTGCEVKLVKQSLRYWLYLVFFLPQRLMLSFGHTLQCCDNPKERLLPIICTALDSTLPSSKEKSTKQS